MSEGSIGRDEGARSPDEHGLRVVGIAGSLRRRSYNRALLAACVELAPLGVELEVATIEGVPLYDADVEAEGVPETVTVLRGRIEAADGLLIVTPEYNQGVPGVLKNAVDWLSRPPKPQPFDGRPVAVMGATPGLLGTRSSQYQLRQSLTGLNALTMAQPMVFVSGARDKFDDDLRLTDDETRKRVGRFLAAFAAWILRFGG